MKRIRRWLFNSATLASLLMLVTILLVWVGSYRYTVLVDYLRLHGADGKSVRLDTPEWAAGGTDIALFITAGRLTIRRAGFHFASPVLREPVPNAPTGIFGFTWQTTMPRSGSLADQDFLLQNGGPVHLGFGLHVFGSQTGAGVSNFQRFMLPDWFVALGFAILPAIWFYRWRRSRRRFASYLCQTCGYDLRATPDRCPECGTPIPAAKSRPSQA
jgi:hypothetical protein